MRKRVCIGYLLMTTNVSPAPIAQTPAATGKGQAARDANTPEVTLVPAHPNKE